MITIKIPIIMLVDLKYLVTKVIVFCVYTINYNKIKIKLIKKMLKLSLLRLEILGLKMLLMNKWKKCFTDKNLL
jgi:hypothetical protein